MIEYNNLTTGEIGSLEYGSEAQEAYSAKAEANGWEVMAWFSADNDTSDAYKIAKGERSLYEAVSIAKWCADELTDDYHVMTGAELDDYANERLDEYIDDCILPELPSAYRYYFNGEAFKRDALIGDGVEHCAGLEPVDTIDTDAGRIRVQNLYQQA